ncbi:MAG: glycine oxidase ThiO [Terriglobales bacterium]
MKDFCLRQTHSRVRLSPRGPCSGPGPFYNSSVRHWDVIIVGGGIIGLSLSIELRKENLSVLVVERGEPGREASHAAAGMLADSGVEDNSPLKTLASASARIYPEFVHELQDESGINCDLRDQGTLEFSLELDHLLTEIGSPELLRKEIAEPEPALAPSSLPIIYLKERSVDPRALTEAALKAAKHRGVDISSGSEVAEILLSAGETAGVRTSKTTYNAPVVVNCAGAWAGQIGPLLFPVRPVKGHMLCVVDGPRLRHVIRSDDVYIVPRSDGRTLIGSTLEEAGFDKRTDPEVIGRLRAAAMVLVPALKESRILEAWAGLRPATPDNLPILGFTAIPGYFVATGHFRDGILLAPNTAKLMTQVIIGKRPDYDLSALSTARFEN